MADPSTVGTLQSRWRADTIGVANGAGVSSWAPSVGTGTLAQATAANQPTYVTANANFNNKQSLHFVSTSSQWMATSAAVVRSAPITLTMVFKLADVAALYELFDSSSILQLLVLSSTQWDAFAGTDYIPGAPTTNPSILSFVVNGTSSQVWVNGTQLGTTGNSGPNGIDAIINIGRQAAGNNRFINGDIAEMFVHTSALTPTQINQVHSYAHDYYGITVANYISAGTAATSSGSLTLGGTATAKATATSSGSLTLGGTAVPPLPKVSTLTDDFSATNAKWTYGTGCTVSGGVLSETPATAYNRITSVNSYDLTNSQVLVQIPTGPVGASTEQYLVVYGSGNQRINAGLSSNGTAFVARWTNASSVDDSTYTTVTTSTAKWIRIREASGTTFWEYSADGSAWTTARSLATPISVSSVQIGLQSGFYTATDPQPAAVTFDNLNLAPTPSGTAAGVLTLSGSPIATGAVSTTGGALALSGSAVQSSAATGALALTGSPAAQTPASTSGAVVLGGSAVQSSTTTGALNLTGSPTAAAPDTGTGTLTLSGTATAPSSATGTGTLTLTGTGAGAVPATPNAGTLTLTGTGNPSNTVSVAGTLTLTGQASPDPSPASSTGTLVLTGTATPSAPAGATGSLTLTGQATARAVAAGTGQLVLAGMASPSPVTVSLSGTLTLSGVASPVSDGASPSAGTLTLGALSAAQANAAAMGSTQLLLTGSPAPAASVVSLGGLSLSGASMLFRLAPATHSTGQAVLAYQPGVATLAGSGGVVVLKPTGGVSTLAVNLGAAAKLTPNPTTATLVPTGGVAIINP